MNKNELINLTKECVLCGSCKVRCPTYQSLWKESFSPRGRMRIAEAVIRGEIAISSSISQKLLSCILCGACEKICPKAVKVPWVMMNLRQKTKGHLLKDILTKSGIKLSLRYPRATYKISKLIYPAIKKRLIKKGILPQDNPLFEYPALEWGDVYIPEDTYQPKGRIVLFSGCATRFIFPYLAEGFLTICLRAGYEVVVPKTEFCCGAPLLSLGILKEARRLAKKNIQYLGALKSDLMVSLCPTCIHTMKNIYPDLIGEAIQIEDSVNVLLQIIQEIEIKKLKGTLLYHHPCHSLYGLNLKKQPVQLLREVGTTITEMPEGCCGFAGTFSLRFKHLSEQLLQNRFKGFNKEAATVVTSCPGCLFQFMKELPQSRVLHIVEVIEEATDAHTRQKDHHR